MKKAFSLAELLITLIIVSCILAAFAPVITKRMANSGVSIGGGGTTTVVEGNKEVITSDGKLSDACTQPDCELCFGEVCVICNLECPAGKSRDYMNCACVDCSPFDANCDKCSTTECKLCKNGYILNSSKKCDSCSTLASNQYCNGKNVETCPKGYSCQDGVASICPENTYSTGGSSGCLSCESKYGPGYYSEAGSSECQPCTKFHGKCTACTPGGCTTCKDGYIVSGTKCAADDSDVLYYKGLQIYKFNAGDEGGPDIPSTVTVVKTGQNCSGKCCWQSGVGNNNTAGANCTNNAGTSTYSGCKRTVCNWSAAKEICESIGDHTWRLPSTEEMASWSLLTYNKGKAGLQLCDYSAGYGTTACQYINGTGYCYGSDGGNHYCFPSWVWASETSGSNGYYMSLGSGAVSYSTRVMTAALSVRCVKGMSNWPDNCLKAAPDGDCTECEQGYTMKNGKCVYNLETDLSVLRYDGLMITKFNAGDKNGPPIPSTIKVVNTGTNCSGKCCWQASATNTAASGCTSSSGTSTYSGCTRTVCNWPAADEICSSIVDEDGNSGAWRLPAVDEMQSWHIATIDKGKDGLQLCDYSSGYGTTACPYPSGSAYCYGSDSGNHYCFPNWVWTSQLSSSNGYYVSLGSGVLSTSTRTQTAALSVRCVKEDYNAPKGCLITNEADKCIQCKSGYTLKNGLCEYALETDKGSLRYNGLRITKYNPGDGYGPPIPNTIKVVKTGTYCTGKCCWQSGSTQTSTTGCNSTAGTSNYSGCTRTVCNWAAANEICNSVEDKDGNPGSWRLPTQAEMTPWNMLTYNKGVDGLQLCDYYSGYGAAVCPYFASTSGCYGAESNYCFPNWVWSSELTGSSGYYYALSQGTFSASTRAQSAAMTVRCVKADYDIPNGCLIADDKDKCTQCKAGYSLKNGACTLAIESDDASLRYDGLIINKYNPGDSLGAPIPDSVKVVSTGSYCTGNCCWQALTNYTATTACTSSAGTSNYSGCKRTVCTWPAAQAICASIPDENGNIGSWRLPSLVEASSWGIQTYNKGKEGLQLCDYSAGYGAAVCTYTTNSSSYCYGSDSGNHYCFPNWVWTADLSGSSAYYYGLSSGIFSQSTRTTTAANTVRCVKEDPNFPKGCLIADQNDKCTQCKSGYTLANGACTIALDTLTFSGIKMTKYNAGDEMGPPIPNTIKVTTTGTYCTGDCCWQALITNTTTSACTSSSGSSTYSGCKRTVCNWSAAYQICNSIPDENGSTGSWRLPRMGELGTVASNLATLNTGKGASGLQLCDYSAGYNTTVCPYTYGTSYCYGAENNYCFPNWVWTADLTGSSGYYYGLASGSFTQSTRPQTAALSVRCVKEAN